MLTVYNRLKRKTRVSIGIDGKLPIHMNNRDFNRMWAKVASGTYRLATIRTIPKKKKTGGYRNIGVLTMNDLVYLTTLNDKVVAETNADIPLCVHSFVRGRSVDTAYRHVQDIIKLAPYHITADIKQAYDNVDLQLLIYLCQDTGMSINTLNMVKDVLRANDSCKGLVQGSPLSPTLFNIYLAPFDAMYGEHRSRDGYYRYFRYADNIFYGCKDQTSATRVQYNMIRDCDLILGMKLQVQVIQPQTTYTFLGREITTTN